VRQAEYLPSAPGTLLDIGTAGGDCLAVTPQRGWQVTGIEFAETGNPHDLEIHMTSFPDSPPLGIGPFDVVTAWAVFGHLHDPLAAFRRFVELLRPGGLFLPNWFVWTFRVSGETVAIMERPG
jgi:2-polyprenyl-3-methyl-5-hydroxy-6-metoxy-1,4-benzoquinol methylase